MQICPESIASDLLHRVEHVMMIVPINSQKHKAEQVSQTNRQQRAQYPEIGSMGYLKLEHHDSNDDSEDSIAESFQTGCRHAHQITARSAVTARNKLTATAVAHSR